MSLFIAVDARTGAQRRLSARAAADVEPLAPDEALVQLDAFTAEPIGTHRWDPATLDYVPVPGAVAPSRRSLSRIAFSKRIGAQREALVHILLRHAALPDAAYGFLTTAVQWLNRTEGEVNLDDPDTQAMAQQLTAIFANTGIMSLVSAPALTPTEAAAFEAALLADVVGG